MIVQANKCAVMDHIEMSRVNRLGGLKIEEEWGDQFDEKYFALEEGGFKELQTTYGLKELEQIYNLVYRRPQIVSAASSASVSIKR
jgi:hypothetical protein